MAAVDGPNQGINILEGIYRPILSQNRNDQEEAELRPVQRGEQCVRHSCPQVTLRCAMSRSGWTGTKQHSRKIRGFNGHLELGLEIVQAMSIFEAKQPAVKTSNIPLSLSAQNTEKSHHRSFHSLGYFPEL